MKICLTVSCYLGLIAVNAELLYNVLADALADFVAQLQVAAEMNTAIQSR